MHLLEVVAFLAVAAAGHPQHAHSHSHTHAAHLHAAHARAHTPPASAAPVALQEVLFPLSAVQPAPGSRMALQQARTTQYLTSLDSTRLACLFTSAANLSGTWEHPSCEPYDHPAYWGHYLGHWLSAAALSIENGADSGGLLTSKAAAMVDTLGAVQAAWTAAGEAGFLFPYNTSSFAALARGENCVPVCVPFYVMHKMLAGMLDMHARAGSAPALAIATAMAGWVNRYVTGVLAVGGQDAWQAALNIEWGGMNDALRNLYRVTGDASALETAGYFVHWAWTDPLVQRIDSLQSFHANTHLPEIIGDLNGFQLTANVSESAIVDNFLDILQENHSYATGGSNDHEWWSLPRTLGDSMNSETEETCTQYNLLKLVSMRFSLDGATRWMDWYARALYGGMIGNLATTGAWASTASVGFHYMLPLGGGGLTRPWGDSAEGFPCCWGTSSEAFAGRHIEHIFGELPDHSGVRVHLFESATLTWPARGAVLRMDAGFPASTAYTARLTVATPAAAAAPSFSVLVRVPFWASTGGNAASLNGAPLAAPSNGSYMNVTRAWRAGDVLEWHWPAAVRWEALADERAQWSGVGALLYGDYLLAGVNTTSDVLAGVDPARVAEWAVRVPDEAALRFVLTAGSACGGGNATQTEAVPLAEVAFQTYSVYWHTSAAPPIRFNGSAVTLIPGAAGNWRTSGAASILANGGSDNIRSGDPGEVNAATLVAVVQDATHAVGAVAFAYQYVAGYGPSGAGRGTNFSLLFLDVCAAGAGALPPPPAAIKAVAYASPHLVDYPFDVCNTCYSPLVNVSITLPVPVDVTAETAIMLLFQDNDRNVQLNLPIDVSITWA